jgi:hypothetical protein
VSLGLSIACFAQTAPVRNAAIAFDEQHRHGVERNPPGVELTIATANGRSAFHFSEIIRFTLTFTVSDGISTPPSYRQRARLVWAVIW